MNRIFTYDGPITDDGMTAEGTLRFLLHPHLGFMWCATDITRLFIVDRGASTRKIREYAPRYSVLASITPYGKESLFTAHPVMMDWMKANMPQWAATREFFEDYVESGGFIVVSRPE